MLQPTAPIEEIEDWLYILAPPSYNTVCRRPMFESLCDICQMDEESCTDVECFLIGTKYPNE